MDTYGLINLSELDRMIRKHSELLQEDRENGYPDNANLERYCLMELRKIKGLCLKLPSAQKLFDDAHEMSEDAVPNDCVPKYQSFEDYITQYTKQ